MTATLGSRCIRLLCCKGSQSSGREGRQRDCALADDVGHLQSAPVAEFSWHHNVELEARHSVLLTDLQGIGGDSNSKGRPNEHKRCSVLKPASSTTSITLDGIASKH